MVSPKVLVYKTLYISLAIQIITTLISLHGFFIKLGDKDLILKDILAIEAVVQFVESFLYIWLIFAVKRMENMTRRRYIDWMITTPIMLLSTIIFMDYKYEKEKNTDKKIIFTEYLKENKTNIIKIAVFNGLMLLFGYLGETEIIPKYIGIPLGFVFFYLSFSLIYNKYAYKTDIGKKLFYFIAGVWSLYGVAAMLGLEYKNISYNILDVVAKNFYGLFIYYKILQIQVN